MTDKTFADVADKAVDKIADGASHLTAEAGKILDGLGQMAPHAWEVAVRQQVLEAWVCIAGWCTFGALLAIVGILFALLGKRVSKEDDKFAAFSASSFAILASSIMILVSLGTSIPQLLNPEYYAAKEVLCKTTGKACDD